MKKPLWIAVIVIILIFGVFLVFKNKKLEVVEMPIVETPAEKAVIEETIGTSVEGREIQAYTYGTGPARLVFVGEMHGGYEWNSVLLAYQFMDYLKANPDSIPANLSITVIPSANPDGVFAVIGKEGRFALSDAPAQADQTGTGRFNAHGVDLNRNFDCKWQSTSTWRSKTVSAGTAAFSEPEALAIKNFAEKNKPAAFVFWHSQSNAVYASECKEGILPETLAVMNTYAKAAGYPAVSSFDAYPVTGDAEGWLASIGIPAVTVELKTHETVEWEKNLSGIQALIKYFTNK